MAHSTKSYSEDLRLRVVKARLGGKSVSEVVALYEVDDNSVYRWVARYEATGSVAARHRGGGRKPKIEDMVKFEAFARAHAHSTRQTDASPLGGRDKPDVLESCAHAFGLDA